MQEAEKKIFRTINIFIDILLVIFAVFITELIRDIIISFGVFGLKATASPVITRRIFIWMAGLYPILLYLNKFYPTIRIRNFQEKVYILLKATIQLGVIVILGLFIFNVRFNRTFVVFSCPILFALAILKEVIINKVATERQKKGNLKSTLLIGDEKHVDYILKKIREEDLALVITKKFHAVQTPAGRKKTAGAGPAISADEVTRILDGEPIELVIIAGFHGDEEEVKELLVICEERGVEVWLENPLLIRKTAKTGFGYLSNIPMIVFSTVPGYNWQMFAKTLFDYTVGLILLPLFCVAYVIIGIGIKLSSPGPVLFKQKRGGLYGKPFVFLKFRTMVKDAEQKKDKLRKFNIMKGPAFKVKDDPRVFGLGRFLRRYSLDELPQIINVLKGEMSIVGPRPLPVSEVAKIKGADRRRLSMKPGLTCLWQIGGRSDIEDFNEWVRLDLKYIDSWSMALDIEIFLKTIFVVLLRKKGAY